MQEINYGLILIAALVATASPGPATLAIAGTSMNSGRRNGIAMAFGILTGSFIWSFSAAFGMAALMYANAWLFDLFRYFGAAYLLFLAYKSFKSALSHKELVLENTASLSVKNDYLRGLAIHLTNPKVILFFGALYSMGVPSTVGIDGLLSIIFLVGIQSACLFFGYAMLFSNPSIRQGYFKMKRGFDVTFALMFGAAGIKILLSKLAP
ncbi:LysE family translocator [Marinomonas arctica]|uniref:LysE family translocator n=2 Tax=Oceanospirillaceae TaxID=135620 RepID=A0A7H1JBZ2_9GAMM|nr:amino acid transporter [Marinomonas sp. BSi20414]QNT08008.1 LysE family translocator [Marinomonas arctica]GGN22873.1 threonine efflux protein [Marinomonas arctica]